MAIKNLCRRLERMERRFIVQTPRVDPESHVALARGLNEARVILRYEREAVRRIAELGVNGFREVRKSSLGDYESQVRVREREVAALEHRCADAGLTEEDIARLAR